MIQAVISKIISMQKNFTVGENEISQYILKNAEEVVTSTITTIAQKTNTSEASVNRFCKKVGFKGFNSFKVALAQETFYNAMYQSESSNKDESLISSISKDYQQMLRNTSALLDENTICHAIDAMRTSRHIFIFSDLANAFVAKETEYKLTMAGLPAKVVTNASEMQLCAANVGKNDFVLFIVTTILMRDVFTTLNMCRDHDAKILVLTSYDSTKLDILADFKIITSDKITTSSSISISNSLVYLFVIDVLYRYLLENDKALLQKKLSNEAILQNHQRLDNYLLDY